MFLQNSGVNNDDNDDKIKDLLFPKALTILMYM